MEEIFMDSTTTRSELLTAQGPNYNLSIQEPDDSHSIQSKALIITSVACFAIAAVSMTCSICFYCIRHAVSVFIALPLSVALGILAIIGACNSTTSENAKKY